MERPIPKSRFENHGKCGMIASHMEHTLLKPLFDQLGHIIKGKDEAIHHAITCLVAGGHLLIEDIPGVGKTTLAYAVAKSIDGAFSRIQFTNDMLPSDVLGVSIYQEKTSRFEFHKGPIFANVVLADEINRTPPKTQSSLLECMERSHISIEGRSMELPNPFMVIATQNPLDYEGTFPLPENQLDRFLMRISMGYPDASVEREILRNPEHHYDNIQVQPVLDAITVQQLQHQSARVFVEDSVLDYMIRWVHTTRTHAKFRVGVSTRGTIALKRVTQARALIAGRDFVLPEDVYESVGPVFAHRILPDYTGLENSIQWVASELDNLQNQVALP